ncbi:MFS transporter [Rhodococcus sp. ACT016]|uniref:MFS transporter n=1 Tax=Rhodococcus sp. ACT016 TaxID=3134808 RepID=UPI003D285399
MASAPTFTPATDAGSSAPSKLPPVVYLLGAVAFLMGTTELIVAGLLPQVADALSVTHGQAGLLVTVFAVGMIVGAPVMAMATLRLPPRATLVAALLVFAAGHLVSALSDSFSVQLAARFVSAVATGTFWAVGAVLATAAAGRASSARATAVMIGGLTLANVLGVPIGTALGQWLGWRGPFWVLAALAAVAAVVLALRLPKARNAATTSLRAELRSLRHGRLWLIYLACALIPGSFIAAYSYIAPLLTERAGLAEVAVPIVMLGYGLATLAGTAFGGKVGDRSPFGAALPAVALIAVILAALTVWGENPIAAVVLFVLLGLVAMVAQPILISQALGQAGETHTLAVALSTAALNVGIATGSWLGGVVLASSLGLAAPTLLGAGIAVAAVIVLALVATTRVRTNPTERTPE